MQNAMRLKAETLARIGLFRGLDAAKIALLDTQCSWRRVPRGRWILDYEDATDDVFFIASGTVRAKLQSVLGRDVLLAEINAGEFFGEFAAIDNQPRSSGIVALTDVTIARMPGSVFRATIHAHPDICHELLALLARHIRVLNNRVNEFTNLDARHRIYAELLRLARPKAGSRRQAVVSPPPVHAEMAARVSIRRETVTRELKALERAGLVERRKGALVLVDTARLRRLIAEAAGSI